MTRFVRGPGRTTAAPPLRFTYPDVGATRSPALPDGYHHLRHRTPIGHGRDVFEAAGAAVTTWRMHRASGARLRSEAVRAAPGARVRVCVGVGPLEYGVPCEVVWTAYEEGRTGFAYGTLTGHPESGEEAFVVEQLPDGSVWFTVTAFSRPARWYARMAGPLVPVAQRWYARRLGRTVRRIARG
ncbi:DUF1990 domain-containing protein [Streptomyces sp. TRM76323]|uniref:DUF1990 domain-containing protein n=1 Tax=Streptomyces tamarix TaxID=3078565 RepID=A0ABU3QNY5_9ACTN|nr:DUF1990 domain-containing protein [Streptomyces tamarix]MDT9684462.1 DUF1990 domain-containing protein [Streptomyces tamarix]